MAWIFPTHTGPSKSDQLAAPVQAQLVKKKILLVLVSVKKPQKQPEDKGHLDRIILCP